MKYKTLVNLCGAWISSIFFALFGAWNGALTTLIIFMAVDFLSGLIVAGVFKKSQKTKSGALESSVGWKGLARKCVTLLIVGLCHRIDLILKSNYIMDAVIIGFTINEFLSIIENAGLMGIPMPQIIKKSIEILKNKEVNFK